MASPASASMCSSISSRRLGTWKSRLNTASLASQKIPNDTRLARRTSTVASVWERPCPRCRATDAPTMENAMPNADITQKGTTSFMRCERPDFPHAQFLLSQ